MAIALISPVMFSPDFVILLETMTAMNSGTVGGGGAALPGSVVQLPPQTGGRPRRLSSNPANPFMESGPGPPLIGFRFSHWLLHQVTVFRGVASRSPMTKVAPLPVGKANTVTWQSAVVLLPPASGIRVGAVNLSGAGDVGLPVTVYGALPPGAATVSRL